MPMTTQLSRHGHSAMHETAAGRLAPTRRRAAAPRGRLINAAVLVAAIAITFGIWIRDDVDLVPDEGLGYGLGVFGLGCMLLLLGYSVRKRAASLRERGRISTWFQIHMLLGLIGPVAILYHCNFRLGSLNSNVALLCALVVSGSGVIGRVLYTRIHHGLSERRRTTAEMKVEFDEARHQITGTPAPEGLDERLDRFERKVLRHDRGILGSMWDWLLLGTRCRSLRRNVEKELVARARTQRVDASHLRRARLGLKAYLRAVRQSAAFETYERFFGLWHVLHLPLCFLLFAAAAVHILAVHMY